MTSDAGAASTTENGNIGIDPRTVLPPAEERPLVTFAVFAYNQEKYIREAVEGAFAQTYEPLEIILSDDCSTDRTFEIMREMAAGYKGPHRVVLNKNGANLGVIDHLITVARLAQGELMVVAAGDDVSYPNRAERLALTWMQSGAVALYSNHDEISEDGKIVHTNIAPLPLERIQKLFRNCRMAKRHRGYVRNIPGFSASYATRLFRDLPLSHRKVHNEDALSTYLVNLLGEEIEHAQESLIAYRINPNSLSTRLSGHASPRDIRDAEIKSSHFSTSTYHFLPYFSDLARNTGSPDAEILIHELNKAEKTAKLGSLVWKKGTFGRISLIFTVRSYGELKLLAPRVLGLKVFSLLKFIYIRLLGLTV